MITNISENKMNKKFPIPHCHTSIHLFSVYHINNHQLIPSSHLSTSIPSSINPPIHPPIYPFIHPSTFIHPPINFYMLEIQTICASTPTHPPTHPSIHSSIHPYPSIHHPCRGLGWHSGSMPNHGSINK